MDISKQLHHDHSDLRALGSDILKASDGGDVGGRDNQFDLYDIQVRRHLAVVEDVMVDPLKSDPAASDVCADITSQHKVVRDELSALDRSDKGSHEWTADFRNFTERFEALCARHATLVQHSERMDADVGAKYEQAKLSRMRGGPWSWNRVASGKTAAIAGAAAAVAGAALAASYFRSGRRASGRAQDDFELRLETDESLRLISSAKVEGTPVVDRDGSKIGTISNFMVDKYTGRVAYAVMRFGGIAGFGSSLFPLPWPTLDYDEAAGGYRLEISKEDMADAPRFEASKEPDFSPAYRREILLFYRPISVDSYPSEGSTQREKDGVEQPVNERF